MLNKELMFKFSVEHIKDEVISLCSAELQKEKLFNKSFNKLAEDYYLINGQIKKIVNKNFIIEATNEEKKVYGVPYIINEIIPLYTNEFTYQQHSIKINTAHNNHTGISMVKFTSGVDCFKGNIIVKSKLSNLSQIFHNYIQNNASDIASAKSIELDYSTKFSKMIKNLLKEISETNYLSVDDFLDIGKYNDAEYIIQKIKKSYEIISLTSDKNLDYEIDMLEKFDHGYSNITVPFFWNPEPVFTKKFKT